jgi:hypothetical protein
MDFRKSRGLGKINAKINTFFWLKTWHLKTIIYDHFDLIWVPSQKEGVWVQNAPAAHFEPTFSPFY